MKLLQYTRKSLTWCTKADFASFSFASPEHWGSRVSRVGGSGQICPFYEFVEDATINEYLYVYPLEPYAIEQNSFRQRHKEDGDRLLALLPHKFIEARKDDPARRPRYSGLNWAKSMITLTRNPNYDDAPGATTHKIARLAYSGEWVKAFEVLQFTLGRREAVKTEELKAQLPYLLGEDKRYKIILQR